GASEFYFKRPKGPAGRGDELSARGGAGDAGAPPAKVETLIIRLKHQSALPLANTLQQYFAAKGGGGLRVAPRIVGDQQTNSLIVGGTEGQIAEVRGLIESLDRATEAGGKQK